MINYLGADFITIHTPLTDATRNIISADTLNKTKKGVRIVNCARGGLVDELALAAALETGHVAGAALDVFVNEPATENVLFDFDNVVATPHLGASPRGTRKSGSTGCRADGRLFDQRRGDKRA